MELSLNIDQHLHLSPKMEQSVRILQMDGTQLADYLKEVMLENPVMEMEPPPQKEDKDELALKKMEWLEQQTIREKENTGYYDEDNSITVEKAASEDDESLVDHLLRQIAYSDLSDELRPAVQYVIGFLDENGYLSVPIETLLSCDEHPKQHIQKALEIVQGLDPVGVGASDLRECLLLQLAPDDTLARRLVTDHLQDIAKNRIASLSKQLDTTKQNIEQAIHRIRQLNPKPGALYSRMDFPRYITPDIVVTSFENQYNVMLCEFSYPQIRISPQYLRMAKESGDSEVTKYLGNKVRQIEWIQTCIKKRNETLLYVAKEIVRRQEHFFRYGPQYLHVLRMRDIANFLEIHESTVSRAVRNKYLQCTHGVYPLRHFFVGAAQQSADSNAPSVSDVKRRITELIESEDSAHPLSDQALTGLLSKQGIALSRRTVANYRKELGFLNSNRRK